LRSNVVDSTAKAAAGVFSGSGFGFEEELPDEEEDPHRPDTEAGQDCGKELCQTPDGVVHQLDSGALDVALERVALIGYRLGHGVDGSDALVGDLLQGHDAVKPP
jgi:hypothetical protein